MSQNYRSDDESALLAQPPDSSNDAKKLRNHSKKVYIKTFGCQMNVYDSERMQESMQHAGYQPTVHAKDADIIVVNTCHIRDKAAEKVYSEIGRFKPLKKNKKELQIVVAGCVGQAEGAEIIERQPMVNIVIGPQSYHRLPQSIARAQQTQRPVVDIDLADVLDKFSDLPQRTAAPAPAPKALYQANKVSAFLTIQEGCDKFCTFCVVPYTRGGEASRPVNDIITEAKSLLSTGVRDITLLGQNVNAYCGVYQRGASKTYSLADLIWQLNDLDGLERIRFTTSHPNDMTDDLIAAFADCPKLMPYLHLPVQSGSDAVLKRMNRKHTAQDYIDTIAKVRAARPDILISGDFIVGFPGETAQDFQATLDLVQEIKYGQAFSFKYSARPGTPAAEKHTIAIPEAIKTERLQCLQAALNQHKQNAQNALVGTVVHVLFEQSGRLPQQIKGRSQYLHPVHVTCAPESQCAPRSAASAQDFYTAHIGQIRHVRITANQGHSLHGSMVI